MSVRRTRLRLVAWTLGLLLLPGIAVAATRPCRIVVFDTADIDAAYSPAVFRRGETNAHYVVDQIYRTKPFAYPVTAFPAIIGIQFQTGREAFLDPAPDLAIVHRSTFDHKDSVRGDGELARLIQAARPSTLFLVYSRKSDTNDGWAAEIAEKARAAGRVRALRFTQGDPWSNPNSIKTLLSEARNLLPPNGCG